MIWKFKDQDVKRKGKSVKLRHKSKTKSHLADFALFGFLKVIAKINKVEHI